MLKRNQNETKIMLYRSASSSERDRVSEWRGKGAWEEGRVRVRAPKSMEKVACSLWRNMAPEKFLVVKNR